MKINFNQLILDEQDKPIKVADKPDLTLRDICINSLLSVQQEDKEKEKFERFEIFQKIKKPDDEGFVELTTNEIVVIKKVVGIFQPPLLLGQAFNMLENKT
jgi:hypothetical protein